MISFSGLFPTNYIFFIYFPSWTDNNKHFFSSMCWTCFITPFPYLPYYTLTMSDIPTFLIFLSFTSIINNIISFSDNFISFSLVQKLPYAHFVSTKPFFRSSSNWSNSYSSWSSLLDSWISWSFSVYESKVFSLSFLTLLLSDC